LCSTPVPYTTLFRSLVATCCAGAAVGGRVVDDDDLVRNRRRRSMKRPEAALEVVARIEADDDDRHIYQTWITSEKRYHGARGKRDRKSTRLNSSHVS